MFLTQFLSFFKFYSVCFLMQKLKINAVRVTSINFLIKAKKHTTYKYISSQTFFFKCLLLEFVYLLKNVLCNLIYALCYASYVQCSNNFKFSCLIRQTLLSFTLAQCQLNFEPSFWNFLSSVVSKVYIQTVCYRWCLL